MEASLYSICVELEIASHELDLGVPQNGVVAQKWMAYARTVTDELLVALERYRPAAMIVAQGHFTEGVVARRVCESFRCQLFTLENTFHSDRIICEPFSGFSVNAHSAMVWFYRFASSETARSNVHWMHELMQTINKSKSRDHASPDALVTWPQGNKRILFIGQCFTDSSLLFGIRGKYSTVEIVKSLIAYTKERNCSLIVKLHPKENGGTNPLLKPYNRLTLRRLLAAGVEIDERSGHAAEGVMVDFDNRMPTPRLIEDSDVVVTINSQGGLEAQALGKEVILLGDSFYGALGTCWQAPSLALLPHVFEEVLWQQQRRLCEEQVALFLRVYFERYCIHRDTDAVICALRSRRCRAFT